MYVSFPIVNVTFLFVNTSPFVLVNVALNVELSWKYISKSSVVNTGGYSFTVILFVVDTFLYVVFIVYVPAGRLIVTDASPLLLVVLL